MLSIGKMAQLCHTSIQTLRLYDRNGLIKAAYVDPQTHYRYYRTDQIFLFNLIKYLQSTDLSLKEIKQILVGEMVNLTIFWNQQEKIIQKQIEQEQRKLELAKFQQRQLRTIKVMQDHLGKGPYVKRISKKIALVPTSQVITPNDYPDIGVAQLDRKLIEAHQMPNLEYGFIFKSGRYQKIEDIHYQSIFKEIITPQRNLNGLEVRDITGNYLCINFMWSPEQYLDVLTKLLACKEEAGPIYEESYPLNYLSTELADGKNAITELRILLK